MSLHTVPVWTAASKRILNSPSPGRELFGYFCPHLDSQIADSDTKMLSPKFERVWIWPFPHPFAKVTSSRRPSEGDGSTERVLFSGFSAPFQMEQTSPAGAEAFLRCRFATLHGQTLRKASAPAELYIAATTPMAFSELGRGKNVFF